MQGRSVTAGWGAISVFNRTRLNRLLQQQFVTGFNELSFLPPVSGHIYLNFERTVWAELDSIVLSKPLLSFEEASLTNSKATLTLFVMSGAYTVFQKAVSEPPVMMSSLTVSEQQGFKVTLEVDLTMTPGVVDHRGLVTLDLARGVKFMCTLADDKYAEEQRFIGQLIQEHFQRLPAHKRVFALGMLDFTGYNPLTPTSFEIRTQAAPGAKIARASNYGDGAVVVFIKLRANEFSGTIPPAETFPFLIPSDQDGSGNDLYSASLVVSSELREHVEEDRLDVLHSLLFPGENVFEETSRHTPHDLLVVGNIAPTLTSIELDSLFQYVKAGGSHTFHVRQSGKTLLNADDVSWSARSINTIGSAGTITAGRYQAVIPQQLGKETVRNVVTASYVDPVSQRVHRASALVMVTLEALAVSPMVSTAWVTDARTPITFKASVNSGAAPIWSQPELGSLVATGTTAIYTPPATFDGSVALEKIKVQDAQTGESIEATVVLLRGRHMLTVEPSYVTGLGRSASVQLSAEGEHDAIYEQWRVVGGDAFGTVDESGHFTAPAQITSPVSVVTCEVVAQGTVFLRGFSVIRLSDFLEEPSWKDIASFTLTADKPRAFANGYQQMAIDIHVETEAVGGKYYPLTEEERSTMTIVYNSSGGDVDMLDDFQEGFDDDVPYKWAVSIVENRFNNFGGARNTPRYDLDGLPRAPRNGASDDILYMQTRARDKVKFHARFISKYWEEKNSTDKSSLPPQTLELFPQEVPVTNVGHYDFRPRRVDGGGNNPPEQEDYDYFLTTTDYWYLNYLGADGQSVLFAKCVFLSNRSTVQWESDQLNEKMFSYTGYVFNETGEDDEAKVVSFDTGLMARYIPDLRPVTTLVPGNSVGKGRLMISLNRVDNVAYRHRTPLEGALELLLLDMNGNKHRLDVGFPGKTVVDSRNKLLITVL
ncbi:hypothetical protein UCMB321_5611 [Pseudomonas batumici]|uniref:Uncharacterized protein n=2 Tax=Pseudomonas batumici TaxID=226910 RepID=A0A0C2I6B4_9PSED|nr:hypothetical protein UCMB321_5611 [Pseudomonas batumici]